MTPDQVADAVVEAINGKRELVWVPGTLRVVMSGLRHVPRPLFRKLPLDLRALAHRAGSRRRRRGSRSLPLQS